MASIRLDKFLANAGRGSRKEVRGLIRAGQVTVDGEIVRDPAAQVADDSSQTISLSGLPIQLKKHIHLMMHKPQGIVTALEDKRHPTVGELIPEVFRYAGLFPVGRLDRDASGLLILTNDGTLCHRLASPRWGVWKIYDVMTDGTAFDDTDIQRFEDGIRLDDGTLCQPARLEIIADQHARLAIHEGKFHQVKRMMLATGRQVVRLHRLTIGPLTLDSKTAPGESRELTGSEETLLYEAVKLDPES